MKIALLQSSVSSNKKQNLDNAAKLARQAKSMGAEVAILPEMFSCPYENEYFPLFAEEKGCESYSALKEIAISNSLLLIGGSIPERDGNHLYNTSFVFSPDGEDLAFHRKSHLFDIDIKGGQKFKESDTFTAGDKATTFEYAGHCFGLAICFDIRFPELIKTMTLQGAEVIFVPAAFNMTTGPLHWELLFRSRAMDNQLFTIGCAPARDLNGKYVSFANSIVCDPWGRVVANAGVEENVLVYDINLDEISQVRSQIPSLSARRPELYKL